MNIIKRSYPALTFLLVIIVTIVISSCNEDPVVTSTGITPSPNASTYDSKYAIDWLWLAFKIVADESRFNPPKAGRVYSYSCIAVYECCIKGMPMNRSLSGQLNGLPQMPSIDASLEYDWPSVLTGAMPVILKGLFHTSYNTTIVLIDNMQSRQLQERKALKDSNIVNRSVQYGHDLAIQYILWADQDGFWETRGLPYFPPSRLINPANWEPVNPGDTAVEPYWGTLRTFALPTADYNEIAPSYPFDSAVGSRFYNDELEVYQIRANEPQEQKDIALFWRDKQLTGQPPGHWVSILNQIVLRDNIKLDRAAECYAYLGIALGDAFIAAWHTKYKYNYLRPQTYIRDYIEQGWTPLLPTPPFPDYPSGHSTSSGACSYVLTYLLGTVAFTDTTHLRIGMAPRSFDSFYDAALECSMSRIYGGIHYRNACENGVIMGHGIGETIVNRIRLRIIN